MREILFRGKLADQDEWVDGSLVLYGEDTMIFTVRGFPEGTGMFSVDPATVGQYIGLTDKNGKKIFEGDIVRFKWDKDCKYNRFIEFVDGEFCATPVFPTKEDWSIRICKENENFSVIGNIHDNPELLEGGAD